MSTDKTEVEKTEAHVHTLAQKAAASEKAGDSMQFAQAALNVANALCTLRK